MSFTRFVIYIVFGIIAIAILFPNVYHNGKAWALDTLQETMSDAISNKLKYTETEDGKDYGKIFGIFGCDSDAECQKYFRINGIQCSVNETCYVGSTNG
jgi:hypothetical protein